MKKLLSLLLCACCAVLAAGCSPNKVTRGFEAMDTYMQLDVYGAGDSLADALQQQIDRLDSKLSATNAAPAENVIYQLNQKGSVEADAEVLALAKQSLELCRETDGALDLTVYPIVEEWGFISKAYHIPSQERLSELLPLVDFRRVVCGESALRVENGMKLDFGAVAKGYAADLTVESLREQGINSAICNFGGTVAAYGKKPGGSAWKVGIADPENSAAFMGYVTCSDKIIATSGSYERYFEGEDGKIYSHIINPKTGYPVDNGIASVSIISENGVLSDGLSTALFVMGKEKAQEFYSSRADFDYIMLTDDNKAYVSEGVYDSFTLAGGYAFDVVKIKRQ